LIRDTTEKQALSFKMEDTKDTAAIELDHPGNPPVQRDDVESPSTENVSKRSTATMSSRGMSQLTALFGTSSKKHSVMSHMVFGQSKSFVGRPAYKEHLGEHRQYWRDIILGQYM
jgi:hypothetical protein